MKRCMREGRGLRAAGGLALAVLAGLLLGAVPGCGGDRASEKTAGADGEQALAQHERAGTERRAKPEAESTRTPQVNELNRPEAVSAADSTGNHPPTARFEVFPLVGYAGLTTLRFNATLSKDAETDNPNLLKRWDYDGDGTWDSGAVRASRNRYVYDKPGRYQPRLLVEDAGGLRDSVVGPAIEIKAPCPAPDFQLSDLNPKSRSYGKKFSLEGLRGRRVIVWYGAPSG